MIEDFKLINCEVKIKNGNEIINYPYKGILSKNRKKYSTPKKRVLIFLNNSKIKNVLYLILFLLTYLLFFLSLGKCDLGKVDCPRKVSWMILKIVELMISCIILFTLIELIFYGKISRFHVIHIIIIFSLLYEYSHGFEFDDHGFLILLDIFRYY